MRTRDPEKQREYRRRWRETHREQFNANARAWRAANPTSYQAINARSRLKRRERAAAERYGLSVDEYRALVAIQGGVCAICWRPERHHGRGTVPQLLSVDHDHDTGRVRGLLCNDCNVAIGRLGEEPARLRRAAEYLEAQR